MLRPAGGGVYTVSTGRREQEELQRTLYGASSADEVAAAWRADLARLPNARVALLGVPSDTGAGLVRGASLGPAALRRTLLDRDSRLRERWTADGVVDAGDVFVVPQLLHDEMLSDAQIARTRAAIYAGVDPALARTLPVSPLSIAERVADLLLAANPRLKLLVLGGDHSVAWPIVAALARHRAEQGPWAIVQPDAHTDLLPERLGVRVCFATWAYHANELIGRGGRLVQVGVRSSSRTREHWESTLGVRQLWADQVDALGAGAAIDEILAHLDRVGARSVYLSHDIDATDAGDAPATGAPEPRGLRPAFVERLIDRLGEHLPLLGADLVEVAPPIGAPDAARRTCEIGADYLMASLRALLRS
jgi:agmatinase